MLYVDWMFSCFPYAHAAGCWCELIPVLANFIFGVPTPLSAFLMIYISCVTDVCAGIALIYESPEGAIMQGKTRDHRSTTLVDIGLVLNQYLFTGTMSKCGIGAIHEKNHAFLCLAASFICNILQFLPLHG